MLDRQIVKLLALVWPPDVNFLSHEATHSQMLRTTLRQDQDLGSLTPALVLGD